MSISERLFVLLRERNAEQKDLAAFLGVPQNTISNWKARGNDPPARYLIPICEFLDVSVHYFLTGTNEMASYSQEAKDLLNEFLQLSMRNRRKVEGFIYELSDAQEGKANAKIQADA